MGVVPYETAYEWQRAAVQRRIDGDPTDALFLLEHPPVLTLGRRANPRHILASRTTLAAQGIDVIETDRGGDVTYHGPGQLVVYPVLNLSRYRKDIGWYLRQLEETAIRTISDYGLQGERVLGHTGVWVDGAKIAAIGVAIRRWVTYHGVGLNVATNADHFDLIVPCGIADKRVTSISAVLGNRVAVEDVTGSFVARFAEVFDVGAAREADLAELACGR